MSLKEIQYIKSDKDTHFSGALAQNAAEVEALNFPTDWVTLGISDIIIESVSIQSDQNLEWDVMLFSTDGTTDTDLDLDTFTDFFNFATTSGKQIGAANQFYYSSPSNNLQIPYKNTQNRSKLHVALVNRSATGKNAGATGEFTVEFAVRPVWGV